MTIRLDNAEYEVLVAWLREQIEAEDEPLREAHTTLLALFEKHLRAFTGAGEMARRGVRLLATAYNESPDYRDEWRP